MKVLIWILTFLIGTIVNTLIGYAIGVRAGSVLLYIVEYFIAKKLCEKWDERHASKAEVKTVSASEIEVEQPSISNPVQEVESEKNVNEIYDYEKAVTDDNRFCRYCGSELVEESEFCSNCGAKVERS